MYNSKNKIIYGFTLIETMAAVTIMGGLGAAGLKSLVESNERDRAIQFSNEIKSVLNGVDTKLAIDGYDRSTWTKESWTTSNSVIDDLLAKELSSRDGKCKGDWIPANPNYNKVQPLNCKLWSNGIKNKMVAKAYINIDPNDFVEKFTMEMTFSNQKDFEDQFKNLSIIRKKLEASGEGKSGTHEYEYFDKTNNNYLTTTECISISEDCGLRVSLNRLAGNSYINQNGNDAMINSHLKFADSIANMDSPLKCMRWAEDELTGVWSATSLNCGIGIYEGGAEMVEVNVDGVSTEYVALGKMCDTFSFDAATNKVIKTDDGSPCGMFNDGSVVQVVDSSIANSAFYGEIFATEGLIDGLLTAEDLVVKNNFKTKELTSDVANFTEVHVSDKIVAGEVNAAELIALRAEIDTFATETTFEQKATFKLGAEFENEVVFNGLLTAGAGLDVVGITNLEVLNTTGIYSSGNISSDSDILGRNVVASNEMRAEDLIVNDMISAKRGSIENYDLHFASLDNKIKALENSAQTTPVTPPALKGWKTVYSGGGTRSVTISDRSWTNYRVYVKYKTDAYSWSGSPKNSLTTNRVGLVSQNTSVSYTYSGRNCNTFSVTVSQPIYSSSARISVPSTDAERRVSVGGSYGGCPSSYARATIKDMYITKLDLFY